MLTRFSAHCGHVQMSEVTIDHVKSFVNGPRLKSVWKNGERTVEPAGESGMRTRKNRKIDLGTLFSYAKRNHYCAENLAKNLEKIRIDEKEPGILRVAEVEKLLEMLPPELIPFTALGLFGGLRPSEAHQLQWSDIINDEIRIAAGRGKKRANRYVQVNATLKAWLKPFRGKAGLPITEGRARKVRSILSKVAPDFKWPRDGLRHSFTSYSFPIHGERFTAAQGGHDPDTMHRNYRALVNEKQARKFWALRPGSIAPERSSKSRHMP